MGEAKALNLIAKALTDPDAKVRAAAAGTAVRVGGEEWLALATKAFTDSDQHVRSEATRGYYGKSGGRFRDLLLDQYAKEQDKTVKRSIRLALAEFLDDPALATVRKEILVEQLQDALKEKTTPCTANEEWRVSRITSKIASLRRELEPFRSDPAVDQTLKEAEGQGGK